MPTEIVLEKTKLLPIKTAAALVPYSRDYVARLAREGKVVAVQTERQWFVDGESLKKFYEQATIEDEVRKRHLSLMRKAELEVKDVYRERLDAIGRARTAKQQYTVLQSGLVVVCGLAAGLFIATGTPYVTQLSVDTPAQVAQSLSTDSVSEIVAEVKEVQDWVGESNLSEVTEPLSLKGGIVLLPMGVHEAASPADFFSDDVTIAMVSTTTGVIRSVQGETITEMQFLRVPEAAQAVVTTPTNAVTP